MGRPAAGKKNAADTAEDHHGWEDAAIEDYDEEGEVREWEDALAAAQVDEAGEEAADGADAVDAGDLQSRAAAGERFSGVLQKFDAHTGRGFIACEEVKTALSVDVYIHANVIHKCGAQVGDSVEFGLHFNAKGMPQASAPVNIIGEGNPAGEYKGSIKSFSHTTGYGFLECPEIKEQYGRDAYLPYEAAVGFYVGQEVFFNIKLAKDGKPVVSELHAADRSEASAGAGKGGKDGKDGKGAKGGDAAKGKGKSKQPAWGGDAWGAGAAKGWATDSWSGAGAAAGAGKGAKSSSKGGGKAAKWDCASCGFSNAEANQVCGGTGPLGCKAQRHGSGASASASRPAAASISRPAAAKPVAARGEAQASGDANLDQMLINDLVDQNQELRARLARIEGALAAVTGSEALAPAGEKRPHPPAGAPKGAGKAKSASGASAAGLGASKVRRTQTW